MKKIFFYAAAALTLAASPEKMEKDQTAMKHKVITTATTPERRISMELSPCCIS